MSFAEALRGLMADRGISGYALARMIPCNAALVSRYASGKQQPSRRMASRFDDVLAASGELAALAGAEPGTALAAASPEDPAGFDDEIAPLDFGRRAAASDVGAGTVRRVEEAVDGLAIAYPGTAPAELLRRVRTHRGYVTRLPDGRKSLAEHHRLLVSGGWLSLLAATCLIDLGPPPRGTRLPAHRRAARPRDRAGRDRRLVPGNQGVATAHRRGLSPGGRPCPGRAARRAPRQQRLHPGRRTGRAGLGAAWREAGSPRRARPHRGAGVAAVGA